MAGFLVFTERATFSRNVDLLHEEVTRAFNRVVRILHGGWWLILVRIGQTFGSVVFPGLMMCWSPRIESATLRADGAIVALRAGRAVGRAELVRVVSRPVPILHSRLRASEPHISTTVGCHLVRVHLRLTGSLTSNGAHVLAATNCRDHEAATGKQSDRLSHWNSLPCLWKLAPPGTTSCGEAKLIRASARRRGPVELVESAVGVQPADPITTRCSKGLIGHVGCEIRRIGARRTTGSTGKVHRYCSFNPFSVDYQPPFNDAVDGPAVFVVTAFLEMG